MNKVPHVVLKMVTEYLMVRECLSMEIAIRMKLNEKKYYVKKFEMEPLTNTFRFFKKGQLRTYRIRSFVKDGVTWSHVNVSPIHRSFTCKHRQSITPSMACHWVLSCITEGNNRGSAYIQEKPVRLYLSHS
jgi:hypothetical protein